MRHAWFRDKAAEVPGAMTMFRPTAWMGIRWVLAFVLVLEVTAAGAADDHLRAGRAAARQGMNQGKIEMLMQARAEFLAAAQAEPKNPLAHYYVAFADWRLVPMLGGKGAKRKQAEQLDLEGIERCDRTLGLDPEHAEALALKAGLQGMLIQFQPASAITLGPALKGNGERAKKLAPESPRVWLLSGINTFHMPAFFGGGADRALVEFEQAARFFETLSADSGAAPASAVQLPDWGHDDAWVWQGRAHLQLEHYDEARRCFTKALEVNPQNGWVRTQLLPELDRAASAAGGAGAP